MKMVRLLSVWSKAIKALLVLLKAKIIIDQPNLLVLQVNKLLRAILSYPVKLVKRMKENHKKILRRMDRKETIY